MAYRAEIEIGVKGARQLRDVTEQVQTLAERVDLISANFKPFIQTIQQFDSNLNRASATLKRVRAGTDDEVTAIKQYVQALGQANTARARQNALIQQEIALQEAAKRKIQPGPTGFSRAQFGPALPPAFIKQQDDQQKFKKLFADLNETAKVISVSNTNTRTSWQTTFDQLNETAKAISVSRLNTQTSWQETFKQLNETAKAISVSRLNTQTSWKTTFDQLKETAKAISVSRLNTKKAWQDFFKEAANVAEDLRQSAARVSLREQERPITVQENISRGRSARIARERSAFLLGSSGPAQLGPSGRAPGTSGFPVAVPLSRAEQKAVDLQNRKLQILNRIKQTRQDLVGLAANLQRLDRNSVVAIADANREQVKLNKKRIEGLETLKREEKIRKEIRNAERRGRIAAGRERQRRSRDAASNALIGGAFPLLFGQGIGAAAGGAVGGGAGGLLGGQFGFGLSLVGTAAGSAIDALVAKAAELGKALDPVNGNVDTIIESLGLANTATAKYIRRLEEVAGKQVALEEATKQLALVVGDEGVQALKEFGEATKDLGNAVSKFITQIAAEAAKLLQPATRATGNVISAISEQRAALTSSDPRLAGLQQEFTQNTGERTRAEITAELLETYREITREAEKEAEARLNLLSPTRQLLASEERKLKIAELNSDILNDQVLSLEKQEITSQYNIANQKVLKDLAQEKITYQESVNMLKANELIMERGLLSLTQQRNKADEAAAEKARRAMDRRMREFKRLQEEQRRADEQRKKQLDAAVIAELNSVNKLMSVDLQRVEVKDGEMAALKMRQKQIKEELNNKLKILDVQYLQQVQSIKSVEEAEKLYQAYLNQHAALKAQADVERIQVINAEKRLTLAREQQVLDENRARRGQLESVRQEGSRFSMQLDDPFNLNPERQRAFEAELRTFQILRVEREKLADLERQGRTLKLTESAENVKLLAEQIDRQKAFIPALEAELALRNELEAAAFKQAETIQKYGFLANELSTAMTSAVQAVVTGTGTVEEAFSTMFANIGKAFIDMATQMLAQKLFMTVLGVLGGGGGGFSFAGGSASSGLSAANLMGGTGPLNAGSFGRANGGPVSPGSTYLVGERGPELLTMGNQGGFVHSNRSEAMDRYRSGGPRQGAQTVNVNYTVTEINGMRFVTEEEFRAGMDQAARRGAKMGQTQTMSTLKNSRSQRSKIGL